MAFFDYWSDDRGRAAGYQWRHDEGERRRDFRDNPDVLQGEGFQRRGWRPGSDYYGDNPERYSAGDYRRDWQGADIDYLERGGVFGGGEGQFRGRGPKGYRRSDERIREDVCECLTVDDRIDASNIDVAVQDGEVMLSGTVSSRDEKRRAEDLIEKLAGVKDVSNTLRVVNAQ